MSWEGKVIVTSHLVGEYEFGGDMFMPAENAIDARKQVLDLLWEDVSQSGIQDLHDWLMFNVEAKVEIYNEKTGKYESPPKLQKYKCRMCKRIDEFEPSPTAEEQETVYIIACRHCATQNRVEVNNDI